IRSPVGVHRQLPLQLVFHESPIASVGNPYSKFSAKVVLAACRVGHFAADNAEADPAYAA
ncbi:hypothetical protein, partial [Komagataeibacter oboediens]|uniref:hypothetical protein n=1 Tax=Komagataeibacter oboediens TaxID=65958 RepID=UPI001C64A9E1